MDSNPSKTSFRQKLLLILFSMFLIFIGFEFGIRIYDAYIDKGFFSNHRNHLSKPVKKAIPFRTFGFKPYQIIDGTRYVSSRHNETYPLNKSEDTYRIICFGGSTTENLVDSTHYPLLLQNYLRERLNRNNIEVVNVGNAAYATPHSIILLALDVLSWNPDLIILSHNINDLLVMYWPGFEYDYSNKYSHNFYNSPSNPAHSKLLNIIFQHFSSYWFFKEKVTKLLQKSKTLKPNIIRESYGDKPDSIAVQVFERNINTFVAIAKSRGIPVLLATQPLQPDEEKFVHHISHKPYNNIVAYPFHQEFLKHHIYFNKIIEKVAKNTGVLFLDNNKLMDGREEFFVDFVHYNKLGLEKLANNYAGFLIEERVLSDTRSTNSQFLTGGELD